MPGLGGSGTAYSKASHIPGPRAGAAPFALKAHPLCRQYTELRYPVPSTGVITDTRVIVTQ